MIRFLVLTILAGALALAAGCGGGGKDVEVGDAQTFVADALAAMSNLHSYHVAFRFPTDPQDARDETRWDADISRTSGVRFLVYDARGPSKEVCDSGQSCRQILTAIERRVVLESIFSGDRVSVRQCEEAGSPCSSWQSQPFEGGIIAAGPSPSYYPGWPLVLLSMARSWEAVDTKDGIVHLRGEANQLRAILEHERLLVTAAGGTSFGEECTAEAEEPVVVSPSGEVEATPAATPAEICRELTFEEALEQQEPDLSFFDEHPSAVDVWVSPDNHLVRRITITAEPRPGHRAWEGEPATIEYSLHNAVQIEEPAP